MRVFNKALALYREEGIKGILRRATGPCRQVRRFLWQRQRYRVVVKRLENVPVPADREDVEFREATEADVVKWASEFAGHYPGNAQEYLRGELRSGQRAILGWTKDGSGALCYVSWLSRDDVLFVAAGGTANPKAICHRRLLVPVAFRRRGLALAGISHVERLLCEKGYDEVWGFIEMKNVASQQLHERLGYTVKGYFTYGQLLGRRFARFDGQGI